MKFYYTSVASAILFCIIVSAGVAQPVTGVWKGTAGRYKLELKLIKNGDSLTGTVYYYYSKTQYKRYSIKGYFEPKTNNTIWWDDEVIGGQPSGMLKEIPLQALMSMADFNCPGETDMRLDGSSFNRDENKEQGRPLHLQKTTTSFFPDEWDWVISNYTIGANDPYIIDSIAKVSMQTTPPVIALQKPSQPKARAAQPVKPSASVSRAPVAVKKEQAAPPAVASLTPEEKFTSRTNILQQVIPIKGDSIELRFYDNAEIDGDSIAVFLNKKLVFKHVMLTDRAYTVKFAVSDLEADNEVVMVAENLGSIPPNTALMVAMVDGIRYEAHLYSTENSSALIRFVKEPVTKK